MSKLKSILSDKSNRFVMLMALVYISWKLLYSYLSESTGVVNQVWLGTVNYLSFYYTAISASLLQLLGEQTVQQGNKIHFIIHNSNITVGEHCLAIPAMYIFTFSILLFPGSLKNKAWFIPIGLVGVALINVARIVLLSIVFVHFPGKYFIFHHVVLFVAITYSLILLLVFIWMKYWSELTPQNPDK